MNKSAAMTRLEEIAAANGGELPPFEKVPFRVLPWTGEDLPADWAYEAVVTGSGDKARIEVPAEHLCRFLMLVLIGAASVAANAVLPGARRAATEMWNVADTLMDETTGVTAFAGNGDFTE